MTKVNKLAFIKTKKSKLQTWPRNTKLKNIIGDMVNVTGYIFGVVYIDVLHPQYRKVWCQYIVNISLKYEIHISKLK